LKQKELVAEYLMSVMPEAITLAFLLRAVWLITMPKHLFVPYDQRSKPEAEGDLEHHVESHELEGGSLKHRQGV
jgi:hypothetical protein